MNPEVLYIVDLQSHNTLIIFFYGGTEARRPEVMYSPNKKRFTGAMVEIDVRIIIS